MPNTTMTFESPGKGTWAMDATHCPKPLVGVLQEVFGPGLGDGMRKSCERYGVLLDTLVVRYVHGFPYVQPKPVGAPEGASGIPPKLVFKMVMWLHPAIRRRLRTAETIFEHKPWNQELEDWDTRIKPRTVAKHLVFASSDVAAMSDGELADHLRAFMVFAHEMVMQDHSYNCTFMLPMGDYLAHATRWTGANGGELMALLGGHSDASSGDLVERRRFIEALQNDETARAMLASDAPPAQILAELEADPGPVGEAFRSYLPFTGAGAFGVDMTCPGICEQPELYVPILREALAAPKSKPNGVNVKERALRERVPAEHRDAFDDLLADARHTYRLRDERHTYGAIPLFFSGRRVLLEIGRRLAARGDLPDGELALHGFSFELADHLEDRSKVDVTELERRRSEYQRLDGWSVPAILGPEPTKPPNDWLPPAARRAADAFDAYFHHANEEPPALDNATSELSGLGVSPGICEGEARVCATGEDLTRIRRGDILVAQTTTVAINGTLPMLAGIVTDRGGALSHAAIVCREYGIPGVVGTREATRRIQDGDRIRIDGTTGKVELL